MLRKHVSILVLVFALAITTVNAQTITEKPEITQYILDNPTELGVSSADVYDIQYQQTAVLNNNAGYVHYYNQAVGNIPIQNATINVIEYASGDLSIGGNRAIADIETKTSSAKYQVSAAEAVSLTSKRLGVATRSSDVEVNKINELKYEAVDLPIANNTVPVKKVFVLKDGQLIPTWSIDIDMKSSADYFSIKVDGSTGELVDVHNYTVYCQHNHDHSAEGCSNHQHKGHAVSDQVSVPSAAAAVIDGSAYAVYPWPIESPIHGEQTLVMEPADLDASPFGWHDTDGAEGAEYTITRGNNVHAYQDIADADISTGDEPDGGDDLQFNFPHDQSAEPIFNVDASTTNLFYNINKIHDFTHFFGFNEVNGNFQQNNYGNGGQGGDQVNAEDLDGFDTNNANFSTPPEGLNGRMQMFAWNLGGDNLFNVLEPAAIAGFMEVGLVVADPLWAFDYGDVNVEAKIVLATDGSLQGGTQVCGAVSNVDEVSGNVAMIDRGTCFFTEKSLNAENAGAVAVVICNVEGVNGGTGEEPISMGAGEADAPITIPVVSLGKTNCDRIKSQIAGGTDVVVKIEEIETNGPDQFTSSFDNGVIGHEFGHGVSTRLTGGSNNSGCLFNPDDDGDGIGDRGEQMGEGWSDFFGLVTTTDADNTGADVRGVGTYVNGDAPNGTGIRVFPYSTDMNVNPQTYDDIANASVPHGVGAVWNAMIWDMYWAFVDLYGFDPDYKNTESGNYKAIKIVIDGLMLQPCRPGFVDGRDAIMEADMMNYGGEHICMIWEVFARRGLGYLADQGDSMSHTDGFENFDPLPTCITELKVTKTASELVQPGDEVNVEIYYANHTLETANSVVITDEIPDGMTYVSSTASVEGVVEGNIVSWDFGDVPTLQEETFSVVYLSDPDISSIRTSYDPITTSSEGWEVDFLEGFNIFSIVPIFPNSGQSSWWVESVETESDQVLDYTSLLVTGDKPVLRFWHAYETELRSDGGFVMISTDGGQTFAFVDDKFILNGPNTTLQFGTFAIPNLQAWSGDSEGYIGSYLDLSDYVGQEITVRFRWGSDDNTSPALQAGSSFIPGWYIDDFELIDLKTYEAEVCITSTSTDGACTGALTTVVDTGLELSSTSDLDKSGAALEVYPNPTSGDINVQLSSTDQAIDYQVSLFSMDGRQLSSSILNRGQVQHNLSLSTADLNNGMYLVQVSSQNGILTTKVVLNR